LSRGATGADEGAGPYFIDFAVYNQRETLDVRINVGTLPPGTRVQVFFSEFKTRFPIEKSVVGLSVRARKRVTLPERLERGKQRR